MTDNFVKFEKIIIMNLTTRLVNSIAQTESKASIKKIEDIDYDFFWFSY